MIGFIIPHRPSVQPLQVFIVSVDEVEKQTGLDFFSKLPDDQEERLERIKVPVRNVHQTSGATLSILYFF